MTDDPPDAIPEDDADNISAINIADVLRSLPLCDEPYLGMQAYNLAIVDSFLEDQEAQLLTEYMKDERTPFPLVVFVSALGQMWVFALYEFLRTWRQRARSVLQWAKEIRATPPEARPALLAKKRASLKARAAEPDGAAVFYGPPYVEVANDPGSIEPLRKAVDRTERLFRRIEALRISLAKHEMPGDKGSHAMAPGYGRIDMLTGSIYWLVALRGNEVDLVSRRTLADECRRLALGRDVPILSEALQEKVKKLPEHSYGVKRIVVVLDDGSRHAGVYVGWNKQVLTVEGHDGVPFDIARILEVEHDPLPPDSERSA